MPDIVNKSTKLYGDAGAILLRIQGLEDMRDRMLRDIDGQIEHLRRLLPSPTAAARYAAVSRWVRGNGGWRGFMGGGFGHGK